MKIHFVRPEGDQSDTIAIFLTFGITWILRFGALHPLALIVGIENFAPDQRAYPGRQVIRGRDDAAGRKVSGRILPCVVIGLECSRLGRSLKIGGIRRIHQGV